MITIHLHNLLFHAHHGLYEEEKTSGNQYEINTDVQFHEEQNQITSLQQTIDYAKLYEIIKEQMNIPTSLLETVIINIGNSIVNTYKNIRSINIQIKKLHPPIEGFQGTAGVSWQKEF